MIAAKSIQCPCCGGSVAVRAAGYTVTLACRYCGALLDVANPDVRLIAQYGEEAAQLTLPLGSRGTLFGTTWEAIGWQERRNSHAVWTEYLLFNPYAGYRWLVHAQGQWQFGTPLFDQPRTIADNEVVWHANAYYLTEPPDTTVTTRVLGEFYWRVQAGETVDGAVYAAGNDMLSVERNGDEINWTRLVALRPSAVRSAFSTPLPDGDGGDGDATDDAAPQESYGLRARWADKPWFDDDDFARMLFIALLALLATLGGMQFFGMVTQSVDTTADVVVGGPAVETRIGTVTINRPSQAVVLRAVTDTTAVNVWIDIDYALVDRRTQQAIRAEATLEYYTGRDSEGPWSEGGGPREVWIASVPRGAYDVVALAQGHHWTDPKMVVPANGWDGVAADTHRVWYTAELGGMDWGVFWTVLALIVGPPAVLIYWRSRKGQLA